MAANLTMVATNTLNDRLPLDVIRELPPVTHEFILPIRTQVIEQLAALYQERQSIASTARPENITQEIKNSQTKEESLITFFIEHVSQVKERYKATPYKKPEEAKPILIGLANEIGESLIAIKSLSPRILGFNQTLSTELFSQEKKELVDALQKCESAAQSLAFHLDKLFVDKDLKAKKRWKTFKHYTGKAILIPTGAAELGLRLAVFPGVSVYLATHDQLLLSAAITSTLVLGKFLFFLIDSLVNSFFGSEENRRSFFMPNFTRDAWSQLNDNRPQLETVAVPAPQSQVEELQKAVMDTLAKYGLSEGPDTATNHSPAGKISTEIQTRIASDTIRILDCESALEPAEIKLTGYVRNIR